MTEKKVLLDEGKRKKGMMLLILFSLGIIFLIFSEYSAIGQNAAGETFDEAAYIANMENRLEEMLNRLKGVEEASVMLTLDGGTTFEYAKENALTTDGAIETGLLFRFDSDGSKEPVLIGVTAPRVRGVSIVCKGGNEAETKEKIIALVSGVLNIGKNRIYVCE